MKGCWARTALAVLASVAALQTQGQGDGAVGPLALDGSGTSNPAPLIWRVMDTLEARAKPAVSMTYRSIGSGAGQADFLGNDLTRNMTSGKNDFACGDVPLSRNDVGNMTAVGNGPVHVPFLVGAVSFFHNIPGVGTGASGMLLECKTLAKIFMGSITLWNDPEIVAQNPDLAEANLLRNEFITIVHRNPGSSSTYAITNYFRAACSTFWTREVGITVNTWPTGALQRNNSKEVIGGLLQTPYSIGYAESGQGLAAGLKEINMFAASGRVVTSANSTILDEDLVRQLFPAALDAPGWSDVTLINKPGNTTWPMTLVTFAYIRRNMTWAGQRGSLALHFIKHLLSPEVAALMPEFFFKPLPVATRDDYIRQLDALVTLAPDARVWRIEGTETDRVRGQEDFTFSMKREQYTLNTVNELATTVASHTNTLRQGFAYQVHAGGSFTAAPFLRQVMRTLQDQAREPVQATYRSVGTIEAQAEVVNYQAAFANLNHFKVGDTPLPQEAYNSLNSSEEARAAIGQILHVPIAVAALAVFYNQQVPRYKLVLDACTLYRIYAGEITQWNHPAIVQLNVARGMWGVGDGSNAARVQLATSLLDSPIVAYAYAAPHSHNLIFSQFLDDCNTSVPAPSSSWAFGQRVKTSYNDRPITSWEQMAEALNNDPGALGFLPASLGHKMGLDEASLQNRAGGVLSSRTIGLTGTAQQALALQTTPNLTDSWAGYSLNVQHENVWPLAHFVYLYSYSNLQRFGLSGPLAKALLSYLVSIDGQAMAAEAGLGPLPETLLVKAREAVDRLTVQSLLVEWELEPQGQYEALGSGLWTFSGNRKSQLAEDLEAVQAQLRALDTRLSAGLPVVAHLLGVGSTAELARDVLDSLAYFSTVPLKMTFEVLPPAQWPFAHQRLQPAQVGALPEALAMISDRPLSTQQWTALREGQGPAVPRLQVLQVPFMVRAVSLMYVGAPGLTLSACAIRKILTIRMLWSELAQEVPINRARALPLPATPIKLAFVEASGDLHALLEYVAEQCPGAALGNRPSAPETFSFAFMDQAATAVSDGGNFDYLGVVGIETSLRLTNLRETAVQSVVVPDTYITATQSARDVYAQLVSGALAAPLSAEGGPDADVGAAPADSYGDWSGFSLLLRQRLLRAQGSRAVMYPIIRAQWVVVDADLRAAGTGAGALSGILTYLSTRLPGGYQSSIRMQGPAFFPVGEALANYVTNEVLTRLRMPNGVASWTVSNTPTVVAATDGGPSFLAPSFVTAFATPTYLSPYATRTFTAPGADIKLPGEQVQDQELQRTTEQLQRISEQQDDNSDRLDLTYAIAVAALVIACVLPLVTAGLVACLMGRAQARGPESTGANGCLPGGPAERYARFSGEGAARGALDPASQDPKQRVVLGTLALGAAFWATVALISLWVRNTDRPTFAGMHKGAWGAVYCVLLDLREVKSHPQFTFNYTDGSGWLGMEHHRQRFLATHGARMAKSRKASKASKARKAKAKALKAKAKALKAKAKALKAKAMPRKAKAMQAMQCPA